MPDPPAGQFSTLLNNTVLLASSEAYGAASSVKRAAKVNVPGAKGIADDLGKRFEKSRSTERKTPAQQARRRTGAARIGNGGVKSPAVAFFHAVNGAKRVGDRHKRVIGAYENINGASKRSIVGAKRVNGGYGYKYG